MPIYHRQGQLPRKRHIAFDNPAGGLYHEHLMGNYGFTGPSTLMYHLRRPTAVRSVELVTPVRLEAEPEPLLRPRHLRTMRLPVGGSPSRDRVPLLFNDEVVLSCAAPDSDDELLYRNGLADEYVFVARGSGVLESQLGRLSFGEGDQLVIPRGIVHRYRLEQAPARLLIMESRGYIRWPKRYLSDQGQLLEGAPFSERDIRLPELSEPRDESGAVELLVKQRGGITRMVLDHHPFDVVGWDGYYYPWAFNIHDFEPITGTIHQPPPVHQLLQGEGWVLCNFCPRPYDFHPRAVPAPYNHSNVMSDEVLYYASKEFMSRKGIETGSVTLHPDGAPHGPHPGRYEASVGQQRTEELAVMVDTFRPLQLARAALPIEDAGYTVSWLDS